MQVLYSLIALLISFKICNILTHPDSKIRRRTPSIKIKRLEILPSIRIFVKGRFIHFHHWMNFSILFVISILIGGSILDSWLTRGILLGGIIQGLTIPSPTARKIIYSKKIDVQL